MLGSRFLDPGIRIQDPNKIANPQDGGHPIWLTIPPTTKNRIKKGILGGVELIIIFEGEQGGGRQANYFEVLGGGGVGCS